MYHYITFYMNCNATECWNNDKINYHNWKVEILSI